MSDERMGLRERKKERTRRTIRQEAFRLFREQGYNETTIEQIADAAEVSPSTFFRYFPTKEQLVMADDLDPPMFAAIDRQPPDVAPVTAILRAIEEVYTTLPDTEIEFERERQQLIYGVPELRRAVLQDMLSSVDTVGYVLAKRAGRDRDDFEIRVAAGALIGSVLGVMQTDPGNMETAMRAMALMEQWITLQ